MADQDRLPFDETAHRAALPEVKASRASYPERYPADFDWAIDVLEEAWAEIDRLRGLLARLEWPETLPGAGPWHICPICSNHRDQGHEPDCWLAKELGR